jgi:AraC-like DNA-binding protein
MVKSLKYLADNLIVSPESDRRQLPLNHPDAKLLKDHDIIFAAVCYLKGICEVERNDATAHVLLFSIQGKGKLFSDDFPRKGKVIDSGQVVILPAHQRHRYIMTSPKWKAMWFYLADTYTWHHIHESKPHIRISLTCHELKAAMDGFLAESLRHENRARLAAKHYAEIIILNLQRELDIEETPSHREMKQRLYKLWDTVSTNLNKQWSVNDLANEVGISPQHLYKVSAQFSGYKPMEMVTRLRMLQAQEYLINTDFMVKTISRLLGYSDSFSFSAAFKRFSGCSPKEYRKKQLEKKTKKERDSAWY